MEVQAVEIQPQMKKLIYQAIERAQALYEFKEGAYSLDFFRELQQMQSQSQDSEVTTELDDDHLKEVIPQRYIDIEIHIDAHLIDLIKCDEIYVSPDVTQFSTVRLPQYNSWSQLMTTKFKGYMLSEINVFQRVTAPTLNYKTILDIFLIKGPSFNSYEIKAFESYINTHGSGFLDEMCKVNKVLYSSFPRSGSTFFRKYLESITGIATGTPYSNQIIIDFALAALGFKGEGHHKDQKTWFVKSHFPMQFRTPSSFNCNKAIVCVRNPLDIVISLLNINLTLTHNKNIENDVKTELKEIWDWYVQTQIQTWQDFNDYWINMAKRGSENQSPKKLTSKIDSNTIPVYFFRFEDLIMNPYQITKEVFQFILGVKSIEGTYIDHRIKQVINLGNQSNVLYKPRSGTVNSNLSLYSDDQIAYIKQLCKDQLLYFGYAKSAPDCPIDHYNKNTQFFDFGALSESDQSDHYEFLKSNKDQMQWCAKYKESLSNVEFEIEKPGQGFQAKIMDEETSQILNSIRKDLRISRK